MLKAEFEVVHSTEYIDFSFHLSFFRSPTISITPITEITLCESSETWTQNERVQRGGKGAQEEESKN